MSLTQEFKIIGLTMPRLTLVYGLFLVLWGAGFSVGSESVTSWIPSFMGLPILIAGLAAERFPAKRKLWMHVAVVFGLLCAIGGTRFFSGLGNEAGPFANPKAASLSFLGAMHESSGCSSNKKRCKKRHAFSGPTHALFHRI